MLAQYYGRIMESDWEGLLDELRWHWGDAYLIHFFEPGTWVAQRRDSHETMSADSPVALRGKITADYTARPVSRQVAPCADDRPDARQPGNPCR